MEALAGRLVRLLEAAVADPDRAIGRLDILSPDERHTILREWNDTARAVAAATLPELFAAQVARTPDAVAVVFEDERLTYGELDARANQLAHHLRGLGVGPEVVVGLCVERSLEMLVGLLGILKAGGAYLPLDPDYPPERLAFMLADAGAPVLLTRAALRAHLPAHDAHARLPRCRLARHRAPARDRPGHRPRTRTTPPTSSTPQAPQEHQKASCHPCGTCQSCSREDARLCRADTGCTRLCSSHRLALMLDRSEICGRCSRGPLVVSAAMASSRSQTSCDSGERQLVRT